MKLTLTEAEHFVQDSPMALWDGWTVKMYKPFNGAYMRKQGALLNGQWCLVTEVQPDDEGEYDIRSRNASNYKKSGD